MDNRCFYELKTCNSQKAAEKMETEKDNSSLIEETELGQRVFTLNEVL